MAKTALRAVKALARAFKLKWPKRPFETSAKNVFLSQDLEKTLMSCFLIPNFEKRLALAILEI
jgi:hypothetical protein